MTIEIITAHEADQLIRMRKPLAWPIHPTCNGSCNQGRMCDCTAAVEEDEYTRPPMRRGDALLAVTLVIASWGAVMLVAVAFGVVP